MYVEIKMTPPTKELPGNIEEVGVTSTRAEGGKEWREPLPSSCNSVSAHTHTAATLPAQDWGEPTRTHSFLWCYYGSCCGRGGIFISSADTGGGVGKKGIQKERENNGGQWKADIIAADCPYV